MARDADLNDILEGARSLERVRGVGVAYQRVNFDPHARERMAERMIGVNQVPRALAEPDRLYPSHSGRFVAERETAAGNVIRVVYVEQDGGATAFVITVIRMSRT